MLRLKKCGRYEAAWGLIWCRFAGGCLWTAHAGDCRAVLSRGKAAVPLTEGTFGNPGALGSQTLSTQPINVPLTCTSPDFADVLGLCKGAGGARVSSRSGSQKS